MKKVIFLFVSVFCLLVNFNIILAVQEGDEIGEYLNSPEVEKGYKRLEVYKALMETYNAAKEGLWDKIPWAKNSALRIVDYYQDNNIIVLLDIHHRKNIQKQDEILAGQERIIALLEQSNEELRGEISELKQECVGLKSMLNSLKEDVGALKGVIGVQKVEAEEPQEQSTSVRTGGGQRAFRVGRIPRP